MTQSAEFGRTIKHGIRIAQPDIVIYFWRAEPNSIPGPQLGLVIAKSVGNAVQRHRVARRLRHVARTMLADVDLVDRVVIRALPSSSGASSERLEQQLRTGLQRIRRQPAC